ncbi:hypothetical protein G6F62_015512 [Rhizopus arrhizus]|nr:hypothetical protein G6F62_015512 [Rhizopus arrhizus]
MRNHTAAQGGQVVTALQRADDPPLAVAFSHLHELLGDPGVVGFDQTHLAHVVLAVGIEARRHQDQFRTMGLKPGQPGVGDDGLDRGARGVGGHGHVQHIGGRLHISTRS